METRSSQEPQRGVGDRARLKVIVAAAGIFGLFPLSLSPLVVSAGQQHLGFTPFQSGILASCMLLGVSIASMALGSVINKLSSLRAVSLLGLLTVAIAQTVILASKSSSWPVLCALWSLSGAGSGCGIVVGDVLLARTQRPTMFAGLAMAISSVLMLCVFPIGTWLITQSGFAALSVLSLACVVVVAITLSNTQWQVLVGASSTRAMREEVALGPAAVALIIAIGVLWIRDGMVWSFSAAVAERVGVSNSDVGLVLGLAGVCGVIGSALSAWMTRRGELSRPAVVSSVLVSAVVAFLWALSSHALEFVSLQLAYNVIQLFTYPFMLGLAAYVDRSGRLAALSGGITLFGSAVGPMVSGILVEKFGNVGLVSGVGITGLVSTLALLIATSERRSYGPQPAVK